MPISYLDDESEILDFLKEVNGIYIPGDSHKAIANEKYQESFDTILDFVVRSNKEVKQYFPIFMMGKSHQSLVRKLGLSQSVLQNMKSFHNSNVKIDLLKHHNDTFLLHQLQNDPSNHHSFTLGEFFNKQ